MPKALRPYFRHDRRLFADVSRLIYAIIREFFAEAASRPLLTGLIIAHQSFGDQLRWNPRYHALVLEGGVGAEGAFVSVPLSGLQAMAEVFRRRVIWLLVEKDLLSEDFARNLLSWRNSGFSIDNSVRVTDARTQESLAQYISRPPVSLKKIRYEPFKGRVLFHTTYSQYFKENTHMFEALDFLAEAHVTKPYTASSSSSHRELHSMCLLGAFSSSGAMGSIRHGPRVVGHGCRTSLLAHPRAGGPHTRLKLPIRTVRISSLWMTVRK